MDLEEEANRRKKVVKAVLDVTTASLKDVGTKDAAGSLHKGGIRKYWKIIRVRNNTMVYQFFVDMLKAFNRDDLVKLWSLVKEKFNSKEPTDDKERVLWVELKRLFELDADDEFQKF
ncbi:hypothetical protein Tco_0107184 [Tanacetum coccineum]